MHFCIYNRYDFQRYTQEHRKRSWTSTHDRKDKGIRWSLIKESTSELLSHIACTILDAKLINLELILLYQLIMYF